MSTRRLQDARRTTAALTRSAKRSRTARTGGVVLRFTGGSPRAAEWPGPVAIRDVNRWERALRRLERLADVPRRGEGTCGGPALDLLLAADYRIAAPDLRLMLPINDGHFWPGMTLYRLVQHIGLARARRSCCGARPSLDDATDLGIVDRSARTSPRPSTPRPCCAAGCPTGRPRSAGGPCWRPRRPSTTTRSVSIWPPATASCDAAAAARRPGPAGRTGGPDRPHEPPLRTTGAPPRPVCPALRPGRSRSRGRRAARTRADGPAARTRPGGDGGSARDVTAAPAARRAFLARHTDDRLRPAHRRPDPPPAPAGTRRRRGDGCPGWCRPGADGRRTAPRPGATRRAARSTRASSAAPCCARPPPAGTSGRHAAAHTAAMELLDASARTAGSDWHAVLSNAAAQPPT